MMGYPLSTRNDISHFVPRLMMPAQFRADGSTVGQGINHGLEVDGQFCADLFPLIPDVWKPSILWAWNRQSGGNAEKPDLRKLAAHSPISTFLHYPLDGTGKTTITPRPPGDVLPKTWEAPDYGYYVFRNSWAGQDDIIFQAFPRARHYLGWGGPDTGTFRLQGLGQQWAIGNEGREVRRWVESVVLFPDNAEFTEGGIAKVTYTKSDPDGSGVVSADLSELCYDKTAKDNPRYERYGNIRHDGAVKPKATHLRSYGVDFSGASGAPALIVLVDKIDGANRKLWLWQAGDLAAVKCSGNQFTITHGDATLTGTFVAPGKASVKALQETRISKKSAGSGAGEQDIPFTIKAVAAQGADVKDGHFFMVATLQRGPAPEVKVEGMGLDAKVKVGGQQVRFDGTKIIFGK